MKTIDGSIQPVSLVSATAALDGWAEKKWDEGVQINELEELDVLSVQTKHHMYEITIINPSAGEVLIRGGELFPRRTEAHVLGASMGGSFLKVLGIYVGLKMELMVKGRRIITSPVRSVAPVHVVV
jgi:hypothetical protein